MGKRIDKIKVSGIKDRVNSDLGGNDAIGLRRVNFSEQVE